jgi:hypothetical protein
MAIKAIPSQAEPDEPEESIEDFKDAVRRGKETTLPWREKEFIRKNFIKAPMLRRGLDFEVTLEVDPKATTSYTTMDFLHIYLSWMNVPRNLRSYPDAVIAIWNGVALHEAGHVILTKRVESDYAAWRAVHHNNPLAMFVENILEDSRINHKLVKENMGVLGDALFEALHINSFSWLHGLELKAEKEIKKQGPDWTGKLPKETTISLMALKGLYYKHLGNKFDEFLAKYYPKATQEQLKDIDEAASIVSLARSMSAWKGFLEPAAKRLYQLMVKYSPPGKTQPPDGPVRPGDGSKPGRGDEGGGVPIDKGGTPVEDLPSDYGGDLETEAPDDIKKEFESKDEAEREKERKAKEEQKKASRFAGKGAGEMVPYPLPDMSDYSMRRDRLARIIQQMKDKLKLEASPKFVKESYRQAGRLMSPILAKAVVSARRMPITDIYQRTTITYEKQEAIMMLIVDLSGSVDFETMKDTLLVLSEAAAGWMPDENYACFVFAANYMRLKTFNESYQHVKGRIGGLPGRSYPGRLDMGGTTLLPPLLTARDMFKEIRRRPGMKSLLILSDFWLSDNHDEVRAVLADMNEKYDAIPILIANSQGVQATRESAKSARDLGDWNIIEMPDIEMLPGEFFKVYKKLAYTERKRQKWKGLRPGGGA